MLYEYDFLNKLINVPITANDIAVGNTTVLVQDLLSDIRLAESTEKGIAYGQIASASGGESLGGQVSVGITVNLLDNWQVKFTSGSYIARIAGGNLVGGYGGDPVAYSSGVQVLLLQSAASTVVVTGGSSSSPALTPEVSAFLTSILLTAQTASDQATKARKMQTNKAIVSGDGRSVSIYDDDGSTLLQSFTVSTDENGQTRLPA